MADDIVPRTDSFDILNWWKANYAAYPIIARMACDVLSAPASTVASESAFSTGERVVSDFRSRLTTDTIEALICLQDWLRVAGWKYVSLVHMVLVYWFPVLCLYPNNIKTLFVNVAAPSPEKLLVQVVAPPVSNNYPLTS